MSVPYDCNYSDFDLVQHKVTYPHYLEVIITPEGRVEYAHPSHQEKLLSKLCEKLGVSRKVAIDSCPPDRYLEVMEWLVEQTGCIPVWTQSYIGPANATQKRTLLQLKVAGVYEGKINKDPMSFQGDDYVE